MPKVTVDPAKYERFELKSAPADPNDPNDEDGFVMLRPLPYGLKLARRSKATRMMMRSQAAPNSKLQKDQDQVFELESHDEVAAHFDFAYCVGDHNLTDNNGQKLNFTSPMTLKSLDPKVGSEIEKLIDDMNNSEDEESLEDFLARSTSSLEDDTSMLEPDGNVTTPIPE